MSPVIEIKPATKADAPAIRALLREADLPHEDFGPHLGHFLVAHDERGRVVGAIGAEVYAPEALLRSFVVSAAMRGQGVGHQLVQALERVAAEWGVTRWWLLTQSAAPFFEARGFSAVARNAAPPAIAATEQFRVLCPSAACFTRLRGGP